VEKTIVDCFDLPQYSGGYPELKRAFIEAKLNPKKMITYCEATKNIAVTNRFSEDLDFTSREGNFELTTKHLENVCTHLEEKVELRTHIDSIRLSKFRTPNASPLNRFLKTVSDSKNMLLNHFALNMFHVLRNELTI
jgi:hypothetical protein